MKSRFPKIVQIAIISVYLIFLAGSIVRMTGSGMGCPDWPKCFGYYIPPTSEEQISWKPNTEFKKGFIIIKDEVLFVAENDVKTSSEFNKNNWKNNRMVNLEGEAFFKVAKGSTFDVETTSGIVRVLGTQFNVIQRDGYFEVICYEGLVGVYFNNLEQLKLEPGDSFTVLNGEIIEKSRIFGSQPGWILNESQFDSRPYEYVLAEFERQYDVSFDTSDVNLNQLFSGSFSHDNYQIAIQAITLPLNLTYSKNNNIITLESE